MLKLNECILNFEHYKVFVIQNFIFLYLDEKILVTKYILFSKYELHLFKDKGVFKKR